MDLIVSKINILLIVIYLTSSSIVSGQILEFNFEKGLENFKPISKNSPFYYKAKANNEFENHCYVTLEKNLVKNVPIPQDIVCRNNIGIFLFKVNKFSKIETLDYFGDLDNSIVSKIKTNIYSSENYFIKPNNKSKEKYHWFVLPFNSNGFSLIKENLKCPNFEKLKIESDLLTKLYLIQQNFRKILPQFQSITILHTQSHLAEMEKRGLILHEEM